MKKEKILYNTIRQIHLYSSLTTVALLLMYIVTSYMFIYHDAFKVEKENESSTIIKISPNEVNDENWDTFLEKHHIKGRLIRENYQDNGDLVKRYSSVKGNDVITIFNNKNEVEIVSTNINLSGKITGLHRLRGYGGSILYNIYAVLLDIVGISLILFAITGVILWLKLLKHNKLAWTILILGFVYVSAVIGYLMYI